MSESSQEIDWARSNRERGELRRKLRETERSLDETRKALRDALMYVDHEHAGDELRGEFERWKKLAGEE